MTLIIYVFFGLVLRDLFWWAVRVLIGHIKYRRVYRTQAVGFHLTAQPPVAKEQK